MACKGAATDVNNYAPGNCTWWCKQNASWIPTGWGNAAEWLANAQQCGFQTSQSPVRGAVAIWGPDVDPPWGYGHCAVVTGVNAGGDFMVSEMNWKGLGVVDTRTASANDKALTGFILPPGAPTAAFSVPGLPGGLSQITAPLVAAAQTAGGGAIIIAGVVLLVVVAFREPIMGAAKTAVPALRAV